MAEAALEDEIVTIVDVAVRRTLFSSQCLKHEKSPRFTVQRVCVFNELNPRSNANVELDVVSKFSVSTPNDNAFTGVVTGHTRTSRWNISGHVLQLR